MEVNSLHLKTALLAYYRFKRQLICADEVYLGRFISDVLVDTGKEIIEVECKVSKSDLWADGNKGKHNNYKLIDRYASPNKFYICVPTSLVEEALKFVQQINPRYGVIEFSEISFEKRANYTRGGWEHMICVRKKGLSLRKLYMPKKEPICQRLCSALINEYIRKIK